MISDRKVFTSNHNRSVIVYVSPKLISWGKKNKYILIIQILPHTNFSYDLVLTLWTHWLVIVFHKKSAKTNFSQQVCVWSWKGLNLWTLLWWPYNFSFAWSFKKTFYWNVKFCWIEASCLPVKLEFIFVTHITGKLICAQANIHNNGSLCNWCITK